LLISLAPKAPAVAVCGASRGRPWPPFSAIGAGLRPHH
jgi:hypothetical protein